MSQMIAITAGAVLSILWGIAHLFPTRAVVAGFGQLSQDNHRIITMEWVAEGFTLVFVGVLPLLMLHLAPASDIGRTIVFRSCSAMLFIMAVWTTITGSRTSIIPIKICPIIKSISAILILVGSFV